MDPARCLLITQCLSGSVHGFVFPIRMIQAQAMLLPLRSTALKIMSDLLREAQLLEPSPCVPRTYHPIERADYLLASPRWVRVMEYAGQISSGSNVTLGELPANANRVHLGLFAIPQLVVLAEATLCC